MSRDLKNFFNHIDESLENNQIDDIIKIKVVRQMNRLRELREKRGLTLDEVAKALGLRNQYVSNYELGKRRPDYETLKRFAAFYNVTTDYLLENDAAPNDSQTLDRVYLSLAKDAQEKGIDPDDIRLAIETINRLKKK